MKFPIRHLSSPIGNVRCVWRFSSTLRGRAQSSKTCLSQPILQAQLSKLEHQQALPPNSGQIMKKQQLFIFPNSPDIHHSSTLHNTFYVNNTWTKTQFWSDVVNMQPDKTRTTRMPAFWGYPPPPHDYPYHWGILDPKSKEDSVKVTNLKNSPKFQIFEFWNKHYTQHTLWTCLIRCANMKWIRWVLLKIQSGHDSVHRQTDGRTDRRTRWNQYTPFQLHWSRGYN